MHKSASDSRLPSWPRYFYFTDNAMQNRVREDKPKSGRKKGRVEEDGLGILDVPEESKLATSGWDKYFFFSVTGDKSFVSKTARMGRNRPAKSGPQTFLMEDFSAEEFARAKKSGGGTFSMYTQSYSQLPRSSTIVNAGASLTGGNVAAPSFKDLPQPLFTTADRAPRKQKMPWEAAKQEKEEPTEGKERQLVADYPTTMTPHLFPNGHKTFVELFATDSQAPRGMGYTVFQP